jgi:predicted nucleotidyltransferase
MKQLSHSEIDAVLEQKCSWVRRTCAKSGTKPARIITFGSASRRELREDSDIDLAVLFSDESELRRGREAIHTAPREDLWPLDLLCYTAKDFDTRADSGGVCMLIRNEGRVLYDAEGDE